MATIQAPAPKRFTPDEYSRLGALGFLNEPVELIEGQIIAMAPIGPEHVTVTSLLRRVLEAQLPGGVHVREAAPLDVGDSLPQPDLAIVSGELEDYRVAHPTSALLVVEVAQASLEYDREVKASLYARREIPEYWIVDLVSKGVIVHRSPEAGRYTDVRTFTSDDSVTPLGLRIVTVNLAGIL